MTEERLLDSEDDFEEEAPKPKRENSTIKQLREAQEVAAKERDEWKSRTEKYEDLFLKQSGLAEAQAKALRASGYEATPEGIASFRSEVLGVVDTPAAAEEPSTESDEEADESDDVTSEQAGFTPTITSGSTPAGKKEYSSNEIVELMKTDKAKADKLIAEGRVARKTFNPGGPAF